ncbi:hypothetical protein BP6252_06637 [Coleophoma cylindrospora]|uniref:Heterokaryon incompatibility domain-containing protein n=1 Tax=Coleophoma cylindrospora TaxID=1849047 RepID=A0A3D8RN72_9HELO|nr:hypothetical protein BP6252_06637 [Coleophoma cylindrospora]
MRQLSILVLSVMGLSPVAPRPTEREQRLITQSSQTTQSARNTKRRVITQLSSSATSESKPYLKLNLSNRQIRLFELRPAEGASDIRGSFRCEELATCSPYIALSYTWGDQTTQKKIHLDDGSTISVGENLWAFLRLQSSIITQPTLLWIDAICINQANLHERNHQVGLMKQIYVCATDVFVWLGSKADNSDLAMEFIIQQTNKPLRKRGSGYYPIWRGEVGKALHTLCERPYWSRMWIIQELLHAEKITVWCGKKSFEWTDFESLYLKLKTLEDTNWFAHHKFHMAVMQSAAMTMVWQRAHWRHPDTPAPRLQRLIEIFRDWKCMEIKDKVFALVGMAAARITTVPDYALSTREVYFMVMDEVDTDRDHFANLLSQVLGLAARDCDLDEHDLIEYKVQPAERLVLRARIMDEWD